ncbi:succinate dehydrogenase iron-sulfur subunit [Aeoliella sp. ICT_H6.2]|uniref:succinate dehydrogenase n=1 Tax=Aeoliella straminimaris TaxID=2954799 RepID=A0A9X2F762_9BACT|nr:succinate dehydrogenase iron-sulfur subunit [Aeoliella straminimaris]MCO6043074.1 succinate dehydrogenase iron-sulfur subunit [Aeoliella straminimaris]
MTASSTKRESFDVRILRQAAPGEPSRWETFRIPYEPNLNVISVLQKIAAMARNAEGKETTPVAWDCNCLEEVCGACTMVINGRVRQSCSALVDRLLEEHEGEIELQPMTKFPVVRDLVVDRSRMFRALEKVKAWVPVDDYYDRGAGPRESQESQEERYPLSECMTCGCCVDACPQYSKVEVERRPNESIEEHQARQAEAEKSEFLGAAPISQAMLFNRHATGAMLADDRLNALSGPGGIQVCGNAQNCVAVCPKEIPLTTSIARAGRQTTVHAIKKIFDR